VIVVWPFIKRERLCRAGLAGCFELEFIDGGTSKQPDEVRAHQIETFSTSSQAPTSKVGARNQARVPDSRKGRRAESVDLSSPKSPSAGGTQQADPISMFTESRLSKDELKWGSARASNVPVCCIASVCVLLSSVVHVNT